MKELTKKDFERDASKRVIKEYKETKQEQIEKDNPEKEYRPNVDMAIEILKQNEK